MKAPAIALALSGLISAMAPCALQAATLLHSNDVLGEIEPCGCRSNPQGGLARKANLLDRIRKEHPGEEFLQVDAGDLLFPSTPMPPLLAAQSELQASYLLRAMDRLHHDVIVPGEKDFALGFGVFERLRKQSKTKFLAANLRHKGKPYLDGHAVFTVKDAQGKPLRVAIFGVVGEHLAWPKELKVTPALAAAKAEVRALRKKADLLIAVTHQGLEEDLKLAADAPGIDWIIGGHSQSFLQAPKKVGSTLIFQSSFRNQYVGILALSTPPLDPESYKLLSLDAGYDRLDAPEPGASPLPSQSGLDDLVGEFKSSLATLNLEEAKRGSPPSGSASASTEKYQTFPRCAECHLKQFEFWRKTRHASALEPLVREKQAQNKECLMCHTVGLGDPQGFQRVDQLAETAAGPLSTENLNTYLKDMTGASTWDDKIRVTPGDPEKKPLVRTLAQLTRSWAPVQCENCHAPGGSHPFNFGAYSKTVERTVCLQCHTPERAPEWYDGGKPNWAKIDGKRAQVTCPAGNQSEATQEGN